MIGSYSGWSRILLVLMIVGSLMALMTGVAFAQEALSAEAAENLSSKGWTQVGAGLAIGLGAIGPRHRYRYRRIQGDGGHWPQSGCRRTGSDQHDRRCGLR